MFSCPKCRAEILQKEFLNRRDKVVCPRCGKATMGAEYAKPKMNAVAR